MKGLAPRRAAFELLCRHHEEGAFLQDLFAKCLEGLSSEDAGLAREIAIGSLKLKLLLDHNIDKRTPRRVREPGLRLALHIGLYQLFFLDRVPAFAAVQTTVELVKRELHPRFGGLANALLKRASREGLLEPAGTSPEALALRYSHPEWMVRRWAKRLGPGGLQQAMGRNNERPRQWVRVNALRGDVESLRKIWEAGHAASVGNQDFPLHLEVTDEMEQVLRSEAFARGELSVQDPAAWLLAELLDWRPGQSFLDVCAAPGGKSACVWERGWWLTRATGSGGSEAPGSGAGTGTGRAQAPFLAADLSLERLRRIADTRGRLGHAPILPLVCDGIRLPFKSGFDKLILDAPCSNLGVLGRRPEARWSHTPGGLRKLGCLQLALLRSASSLVNPGGKLVYATCSPEPEETLDVLRGFLAKATGWSHIDAASSIPLRYVKEGCLWVHPGETECDGFFGAVLTRALHAAGSP